MSVNDLDKFRDEWKAELRGDAKTQESEPSSFRCIGNDRDCRSELDHDPHINPAFRDSSNSHSCLFTKEDKTSNKFYPFRIVDDLLSSKDSNRPIHSKSITSDRQNFAGKKRKASKDVPTDWHNLSSKKIVSEKDTSERYLDLFIADLVCLIF